MAAVPRPSASPGGVCPGCGRRPDSVEAAARLRAELAVRWLVGEAGGLVARGFCHGCVPAGPVGEVVCGYCGDGPLLGGSLAGADPVADPAVAGWLAAEGLGVGAGADLPGLPARVRPDVVAMKHVDAATRAVVVARLREKRDSGASISADVRRAAAALVVADSTVWRWLATGDDPAPRRNEVRYELTDADRDDYLDWRGNVAALRRARIAAGGRDVPPLRTLQRAFARQLSPAERAAAVDGVEGRRRHEVYLRWETGRA